MCRADEAIPPQQSILESTLSLYQGIASRRKIGTGHTAEASQWHHATLQPAVLAMTVFRAVIVNKTTNTSPDDFQASVTTVPTLHYLQHIKTYG